MIWVILCRGYLAPEYVFEGRLSEKVDIYSFGVVLLEVVSGRKNIDPNVSPDKTYLPRWVSAQIFFIQHVKSMQNNYYMETLLQHRLKLARISFIDTVKYFYFFTKMGYLNEHLPFFAAYHKLDVNNKL